MVAFFCSMYIYYFIGFIYQKHSSIYLFKLLRLLHDRIDPTVKLLRKNPSDLENNKTRRKDTSSVPPIGVPSWCLNKDALERFNRSNVNIPVYDHDTDSVQESDSDIEDESNDKENPNGTNPSKKKKRKSKKSTKQKRNKKHKKHKSK